MKVTNWRRKLMASLVAGGLLAPSALYATNLDTNLVVDPGFEDVSGTTCCFGANRLNSWTGGTQPGFAYAYSLYYDNGGPLAGGGDYYFTSNGDNDFNGGATDVDAPGKVSQTHAITPGAGADQIAIGEAAVVLSGFFSSYLEDGDYGHLHVEFLNSSNASLGTAEIDGSDDTSTWLQRRGAAFVPVGTATIKASVYGTAIAGGPDGYIDNVDVRLVPAEEELLFIEVDTITGDVSIRNQTGDPVHIDYYEIVAPGVASPPGDYNNDGSVDTADFVYWRKADGSAGGYNLWREHFGESGASSLDPVAWDSLQEPAGNPVGFPSGGGTGNGWEEFGGSSGSILSEGYLTGNSLVAHGASIPLGEAFNVGSPQNLVFRYGVVSDDGMGFVGPGELVQGFVRYFTPSDGSGGAVPEPSSVLLIGIGLMSLVVVGRRGLARDEE
jgi:hypothetical protein